MTRSAAVGTSGGIVRGSFWKERVEMAQWWADHLDTLRKGGKVVPMRRSA